MTSTTTNDRQPESATQHRQSDTEQTALDALREELARRTLDAMVELSTHRLVKTKRERTADGLTYTETVVVLKADVDLPGESTLGEPDGPNTNEVAG
ncbi:hypothetical protein [Halorussus caseinilyticus]|uniref:Uncharacterized protein n=1 Tax=Halorussus caseinilyticus TaxID=3034025 RepID=A0ABD5WFK6_9EURY|nr:hypothetical protein [Halorussus sp. DT72]